MNVERGTRGPEHEVVRDKAGLPSLKEGYARVVHFTHSEAAEQIIQTGLKYKWSLDTTARLWQREEEVEFSNADRRFNFEGAVAVVLDMPIDVCNLHQNRTSTQAPGVIPPEYIVGIVPVEKQG